MSAIYGVWSDSVGGFIDADHLSIDQAEQARAEFLAQDEAADDLRVLEMCAEHRDDEQPANGCESCNADDD